MLIYSHKIIHFIQEVQEAARQILAKEVGLKVLGERFYNKKRTASYPLHVVVFNHNSRLGYFDPLFYEMGFHERLQRESKELLHQVIRHELAHYLTFIERGAPLFPHGEEFLACCQKLGWGKEVSQATVCLGEPTEPQDNPLVRKVQKLLALATSRNPHEAESAMLKSQEILLKHNLDISVAEETLVLKRVLSGKNLSAKMRAISNILHTFFVSAVFRKGLDGVHLEIVGTKTHVEVAEYVASVLDQELDRLWLEAQRQAPLRGVTARNSFFLGLARGYCNKVEALKKEYPSATLQAVLVLENQLQEIEALVYGRLSRRQHSYRHCPDSSSLGEKVGSQLNIKPALRSQGGVGLLT